MDHRQFNRRNKNYLKQSLMFFMIFLIFLNSMLPSISPMSVQAEEVSALEEPQISKDVDGKDSKEVQKGEPYRYNVSVKLPEDIERYETMAISDEVDNRLTVQEISLFIDDQEVEVEEVHKEEAQEETEEQADEGFQVVVDEQEILLELEREQFEGIADKEIRLQITAQVKEDATTGEGIESIAKALINDSIEIETNPVVVIPVDKATEEEKDIEDDSDSEEANEEGNKSEDENAASKKTKKDTKSNEKNTTEKVKNENNKEKIEKETKENKSSRVQVNNTLNEFKSISQNPKTTMLSNPGEGSYIDYDYSFTPKMTSETELTVTPGANTNYQMDNNLVKFTPQSGTTVNGELYYTNVGMYNDEIIDTKIEISAVNVANGLDASLSNYVARGTTHPGPIVTRKMTFISQKTGQPIELAGYVSFRGITGAKYLDWNTPIKDIFAIDDSQIIYEDTPNGIRFFSTAPGGSLENDTMMTIVFEPTSTIETVFDGPFSSVHGAGFEQFSLTGIVPPGPSKNGSIIEDKEISENEYPSSREKVYEIYQNVPYQSETSYYSSFEITDELDPVLKVAEEGISVQNTLGEDVTNLFDISVDNHRLIVEAKSNTLTNESFYNQLYTITINGSLDLNSDYEKYIDEDDYVAVPNTVTTTVDGDLKESNEALAKFKFEELELPEPPNACVAPVSLINGSFEEPQYSSDDPRIIKREGWFDAPHDVVPGWNTTDSSGIIEIMNKSLGDQIPPGDRREDLKVTPAHGQQFAELNSLEAAQLYQDVDTTPGQTIYWRLAHKGRSGEDTMALKIDSATVDPENLKTVETMTTGKEEWKYYSGTYVVPAGQTKTRFGFEAVSSANGKEADGNFLDDIFLGTEPCVDAEKTVSPDGEVSVGEELTYEVTVKNSGGDVAADMVIEDEIPEGTEYVPGSMKILNGPSAGDLTDEDDEDAGHYADGKVTFNIGDLPNTTNMPDGVTVQFKVITLNEHAGKVVVNEANVKHKNLLTDEDHETPTNETETPVEYKDPELDSKKSAELEEKAEGNMDEDNPEVGDTLRYTITTSNVVEGSLVENLVITDAIPGGLTYVEGSLEVDGVSVTDEEDDDAGHVVDGEITGNFGNITDLDEHSVTFLVTVDEGQAGNDIKNIAEVKGDNTDVDEPEEEVKVYPRDPVLEAEKSAVNAEEGKEKFEVGDTIIYAIQTRNIVSDSLVEDLVIVDELPEGLVFVDDSLEVSHNGEAEFTDGKITASFGDVEDTEWRTVTFEAVIESGQSGKEIENTAQITSNNTEDPEDPTTTIIVDPKDPQLDSDKSSSIEEKAEGNTDVDNPEVGDTLRYTIITQNTIEDSLVENLVITDIIPEGLTYVEGSLEVDGVAVTDAEEDDAGHVIDGNVTGNFGDVTDTDEHTVTFLVTVDEGQAGKDINNVATVGGGNTPPDEPETGIKVYPRDPVLEAEKSAVNLDRDKETFEVGDTVVYTIMTRNTVSDSQASNLTVADDIPEGLEFIEGSLVISHEGTGTFEDGVITANFGDVKDTEWRIVAFQAKVLPGQAEKEIENIAQVTIDETEDPEEPSTKVKIDPKDPEIESEKSSEIHEKLEGNTDEENAEVGDTLLYTIQSRNTIEDSKVTNYVITDDIPEGLEYVEGSLEVDGESVTDNEDDDKGHFVDGIVTGNFGNVTDTEWHTVEFLAVVKGGQAGKDIKNTATAGGDNTTTDEPEEEVKVYPRNPVLESEKSAKNLEEDKEIFEVGDTVEYTIKTRNTVSDSLVEGLTITDNLPAGLEYVAHSLEVDGESVTDAEDDDKGHYVDGTVAAQFGDVTDTEWHTVVFHVKVKAGQSEKTIVNTATSNGDNVDPEDSTTTIVVEPKDPQTESKKSSDIYEKSEGNTDENNPEVGDTILYTIQTRNTEEDSIVKNLVITDEIPDGLEYVEGSLAVDGEAVSDAEDDDSGHMVEGTVKGQFGDIRDTDWHTLEFLVVVGEGQAGKDIKNVASVEGDNTTTDEPEEEVKVYPREPKLESEKTSMNSDRDKEGFEVGDTVVYSIMTRNTVSDSLIENLTITDELPNGLEYIADSATVSHEGTVEFSDGAIIANFGDVSNTEWHIVTFEAKILTGQAGKDIENIATIDGDNIDEPDKPREKITVDPKSPVLDSEKSAELFDKAEGNKDEDNPEVGDTLVYTIKTKNTMEDSLVRSLVITDELPEGLKYVEGSLKIDGQEVTDAKDEDQGQVVDGTIAGHFGDVKDTDWHIVEFLAEVKEGQAGKNIQNIALVDGDNVDEPNRPEEEVKIYPRHSVFESEKLAVNADKDKENYEVGDTIIYTITTRNTIEDSLVENLTITDELPEGLEYVVDSLEVSHDGAAEFKDGTITAQFGDVTDTEWRTVTFQAKVLAGQSEKMIENIAVVEGDNVDEPDKPQRKIVVDPISPILESEKSAENAKKDKDNYEVGDTVIYTIKARNTVSDSLVENLTITDNLPDGLEFVEGSLEVSHEGNGEFKDGAIIANFGDVEDTDWRIVTFEAKIQSDQHAEVIKNIAEVSGGNVIDSIKPEAEIEVEPKEPTVTPKPEDPKEQKPTKTDSEVIETISGTDKGSKLPRTATNMYTYVLAGILLVLVGLGFAVIRRKNTRSN